MLGKILEGTKPSALFRQMLAEDPCLEKREIGPLLCERFPQLDTVVIQLVWGWEGPGSIRKGLSDESLDIGVLHYLTLAGYLPHQES